MESQRELRIMLALAAIMYAAGYVCGGLGAERHGCQTPQQSVLVLLPDEPAGHPGMTREEAERLIELEVRDILAVTDQPCVEAERRLILLRRGIADEREEQRLIEEAERLHYACVVQNVDAVEGGADLAREVDGTLRQCTETLQECYDALDSATTVIERGCVDEARAFPPMIVPALPDII